jgi:hypothetical protein
MGRNPGKALVASRYGAIFAWLKSDEFLILQTLEFFNLLVALAEISFDDWTSLEIFCIEKELFDLKPVRRPPGPSADHARCCGAI